MGGKRICCVPMCPRKARDPGISFHEIPSNLAQKEKWLKLISRADPNDPSKAWIPGSRAAVCSDHFVKGDYVENHKQRRLKEDATPSVFPNYPAHKLPAAPRTRKAPAPRKSLPTKRPRTTRDSHEDKPTFEGVPQEGILATEQSSELPVEATDSTPKKSGKAFALNVLLRNLRRQINVLQCAVRRKDTTIKKLSKTVESLKSSKEQIQETLSRVQNGADEGDIKAILLLQQIEAYRKTRFRWSEIMIRSSILLRNKSPKAYDFSREHFLSLPCRTTLQKYIGPSNLDTGFTQLAKVRLLEEFKLLKDTDQICSLIFDEMSITPRLEYKKQADRIVGKAEYGRGVEENGVLANRLLCFVLKGLTTNYRIPVAYYLVRQLQGKDLAPLILEVMREVEFIGFKVFRLVCDDATTNVKALEIVCGGTVQFSVNNPIRSNAPLFISFDQSHIIKNIRNQFLDDERNWRNNNKPISAKPIKFLYDSQKELPIKPVRFLTRKVVYPTTFEKMNVGRAIKIFSTEVIAALEFCQEKNMPGFRNIEATIEFMKIIRKWFMIHNVCNTSHYITSREENRKHFELLDDERLDWLINEFLPYLSKWQESVRNEASSKGKSQGFFTRETYNAIVLTTRSTVACVRYLIQSGFPYVLTRKFSSDDVEGIFAAVRAAQGSNDQANGVGSLYALETILKTGLFACGQDCNVGTEAADMCAPNRQRNVTGRELPEGTSLKLTARQEVLVSKLGSPPDIPNVTTKNAGVVMVAGFTLRLLKDKHECLEAGTTLKGVHDDRLNSLITLQDRGGLLYPASSYVRLFR